MAFAGALSTPRCIPHSPYGTTHGSLLCAHNCVELKCYQTGRKISTFSSTCRASTSPAKESSGVRPPIAIGESTDVPISRREAFLQMLSGAGTSLVATCCVTTFVDASSIAAAAPVPGGAEEKPRPQFYDLDGSGGVKALDIRQGTGATPKVGDKVDFLRQKWKELRLALVLDCKVAIHYYARLAAKQGWRFDSSYDHKDQSGAPEPYVFVIGDGTVITGLDSALRSMKEGGVRRVIIPPSQGYQTTEQGPIPPNFSDRQRLYTTIFNPTRIANGEGATLGILVFDIELLGIRPT